MASPEDSSLDVNRHVHLVQQCGRDFFLAAGCASVRLRSPLSCRAKPDPARSRRLPPSMSIGHFDASHSAEALSILEDEVQSLLGRAHKAPMALPLSPSRSHHRRSRSLVLNRSRAPTRHPPVTPIGRSKGAARTRRVCLCAAPAGKVARKLVERFPEGALREGVVGFDSFARSGEAVLGAFGDWYSLLVHAAEWRELSLQLLASLSRELGALNFELSPLAVGGYLELACQHARLFLLLGSVLAGPDSKGRLAAAAYCRMHQLVRLSERGWR